MDKFNKEILEDLAFYQLRAIAYNIGLKNAAKFRKKDLIDKIINFEAPYKISNVGRPSKYKNSNLI